ncbi:MAG: alpha/beta hydrolase-fold protein [Tissierellia bacterium]|nr:alpha/beta hydrolase-fold protein [Tissierellia bacterium]
MGKIIELQIPIPYLEDQPLRNLRIYLPKAYDSKRNQRFPVLYMHDGQNLYHNKTAYSGVSWGVKQHLQVAERMGLTDGIIVVGIDNGEDLRIFEYSALPFFDYSTSESSEEYLGLEYADFIVNTLKPLIDENFRTLPDREHTWMAGSSAGANITFFTGLRYPDVFSKLGLFSTALWLFDDEQLNQYVDSCIFDEKGNVPESIHSLMAYVYAGTEEGGRHDRFQISQSYLDSAIGILYGFLGRGLSTSQVWLDIVHGKDHSERSWRSTFPKFIDFLTNNQE